MLRIALGCLGALTVWFATSCAAQAQTGTLTAGSVETTTAELSIGNWSGQWWHNYTSPFGGTCSAVVSAGTSTVGLTGLSGNTPYTFHAFNNPFCAGLPIATAPAFVTKPGKPATPSASAAAAGGDDLTLSSSVSGSGAVSKWQYRHREGSGSFGDWTDIAVASAALSHTVYGLAGGSVHQFRVRAVNAAGAGLESDASAAVSPLERTLTADSVGAAAATLTMVNWPLNWHYRHTAPSGGTCSAAVPAGTSTANLTGLSGNTWHTYGAYYSGGCFWQIANVQFLTKPGKPATPTVSAGGGSGTLTLSSSVSGGGSLTKWQFAQGTGGSFGPWQDIPVSSTTLSHTVSGLTDGTDYEFMVRAVNATGTGQDSDASAAAAPLDETLTASAVEASAAVLAIGNWPGAWWHRQVSPSGGTCSAAVSAGTSTVDLTGLSGNTWHSYGAYGFGGCNAELADIQFLTKPGKPATPTVAAGSGSGTLTLSSSVSGDGSLTKWQFAQGTGGSFGEWQDIPDSASTTLSHAVSGLTNGTDYEFRVRAVNETGTGQESGASAAAAPLGETLTAGSVEATTAVLTIGNWSGTWWHNHASPSGGTCSAAVSAGTSTVDLTGLSGNTDYTFMAYSDSLCTVALATAPAFLTKPGKPATPAVAAGGGSGTLRLSSSVSGSGSLTKWQYAQREGSGAFGDWTDIPSTSTTLSHTLYGLTNGTDYGFRVRAVNATGNGLDSDASAAAAPLGETLTAGSVGVSTATLTIGNWNRPWWHNYTSPWGGTCSPVVSAGTSTVDLAGLSGNTPYTFHAFNNPFCAGLPLATAPAFLTKPGKAATPSVSTAAAGGDELTLSSSVSGGGTLTKWQYRRKEGDGSFGQWRDIPNSASTTLSHTVSGLAGGTVHSFTVRAVNETGDGVESDASEAVSPLDQTLTAGSVGSTSAELTIVNWSGDWSHKRTVPSGGTCSAEVLAGTSTVGLAGLSGNTWHTYSAYYGSGCFWEIATAPAFLTKPGKPATPTVSAGGGGGTLTLSSSVSGSGSLTKWQYAQGTGGSFGPWQDIPVSSTTLSHTVSGLTNGTDYRFRVRAVNETGNGLTSDASAAAAPLDETLTASSVEAEAATLEIGNWPGPWWHRQVSPSVGTCSAAVSAGTSTADLTGLSGNTWHSYRAYGFGGCNAGLADLRFLTRPGKPATPTVAAGEGSGTLRLSSSVSGDGTPTKWQYAQREGSGSFGTDWTDIPNSASTTLSHAVSGLTDGTDYGFMVRAVNATGDGVESDASAAAAPLGETLTAGSLEVSTATLTIGNWPGAWHYKQTSPSDGTCSAAVSAGTSTASLTDLSGNTDYTHTAYSDSGCTLALADVRFLTKPGKPATPTVAAGDGSGKLRLSSSVSGDGTLTEWQYALRTTGSFGQWQDIPNSASTTLSHAVSGLDDGTDYEFRVRAVNETGTGPESDASAAAAPLDETLTAGDVEVSTATLTIGNWPGAWYHKRMVPSGGTCHGVIQAGTSTAKLKGLSGNTWHTHGAYTYRANGNCIAKLADVRFLTKPGKPATPAVAAGGGSGRLTLSSSVSGDGTPTKWQYAQREGVGSFGQWRDIPNSASTTLSHAVSGLDDGTDYEFRVRAVNETGTGQDSDASAAVAPHDARLTAGSVEAGAAVLTIANWTEAWHHRHTVPSGGICSAAVAADTTTANLTGLSGNTNYTHVAYSDSGCTTELAFASPFLTKPGKPTGLTATAGGGSGTLALSSDMLGGDGDITKWQYKKKEGSGSFGDWTDIPSTSTTLSHTVSGLDDGTDYQFRVRAVNETGDGVESDASAAVVALDETLIAGSVEATTAVLTIGNWPDAWYHKQTSPSGGTCSAAVAAGTSAASLTGLSGNTNYTHGAYSNSLCTAELASASPFLTKPGKPTGLTATAGGGSGTLALSSDTLGGDGTPTKWQYAQKVGNGSFGEWQDIPNSASTTLSHAVSGLLTDGTEYQFRVRAVNATGVGLESDASAAVVPLAPTLTAGSVEAATAVLTIGNWPNAWHYKHTVPSGGACSAAVAAGTSTASLTGLSGNTNYTHTAYSDSGCTTELASASPFLTKPGQPTGLTATAGGGSGTLALSSDTLGGDGTPTKWQYAQREGSGSFDADWTDIPDSASTTLSHTVSGLADGTDYQFRVRAVNETGDGVESDASAAVAPLDETLTAGSVEVSTAVLTIGNWPNAWHHKHTGGTCSAAVAAGTSAASLTGLSGNTNYTHTAYSDSGCTTELASASSFLTKPGKPTGLTATAGGGSGTLALSSSVGGSGVLTKWQYAQKEGSGAFGDWTDIAVTSTTLSHTVSGLTDGTDYGFRVRAVNATGTGQHSDASAAVAPHDARLTTGSVEVSTAALTIGNWAGAWHYNYSVKMNVGPGSVWATGTCSAAVPAGTSTVDLTGLSGNAEYTHVAYSDSLCTAKLASAPTFRTKPGKPTTPTVIQGVGSRTLVLSSSLPASTRRTYGFRWEYAQKEGNGGFGPWKDTHLRNAPTLSDTLGYFDGLKVGTEYQFKVRVVNSTGAGPESDVSAAVAVIGRTLTVSAEEVTTATLTISNWSEAWHYRADVLANRGWYWVWEPGNCSAAVPAGTSSVDLAGLSGNTTYRYRAYSDGFCRNYIDSVDVYTKPGKPTRPTIAAGSGSGTLTLSSSMGGDRPIQGWQYKQKTGAGSFGEWTYIPNSSGSNRSDPGTTLSHTVSGLTNGTNHQFKVRVVNYTGDGLESDASAAVAPHDTTLTAGSVEATTATLTIANRSGAWHYKHMVPSGGSCSSAVPAGTSATDLTGLSGNTDYRYVAYSDSLCTTELAVANSIRTKPGKPTTPTVTALGSGTLTLSSSVSGEGTPTKWQYALKAGSGSFGTVWTDISSASTTLSHTVSGLTNGTEYQFMVRAVNATGDGVESDASAAVVPDRTLTAGSVEATTATLTIANWTGDWHYKHTVPSGGTCSAAVPAGTSAADLTGLSGNTNYTYSAYSDSLCTTELASASSFLTKPGKPTTPTVTALERHGALRLSSSVSGDGTPTKWQYAENVGSGAFGDWTDIPGNASTTLLRNLSRTGGGEYQFRVRAVNATGNGLESDASAAVTAIERRLTASSVEETTATLTISNWSEAWHSQGYTWLNGVLHYGTCSAVPAGTSTANLTDLSGNTRYTYYAYSDSLCTAVLDQTNFLTKPGKPTTPTVTAGTGGRTLVLSSSVGGRDDMWKWQYKQKEGTGSFGDWTDIPNSHSRTLSHAVSNLTIGTDHQFKVRAVNATGTGPESDGSAAVAPDDRTVTAGSVGVSTVALTVGNWTEAWWYKHTVPSNGTCSAEVAAGTSIANVTGLSGNTNYTFRAYSDSLCTTELAAADQFLTKPGKPASLTVGAGSGSGTLTLSSSVSGGDGSLTKWQYAWKIAGINTYSSTPVWREIPNSSSTTLSHTVSGLMDGNEYVFIVRAVNATGYGEESDASAAVAPVDAGGVAAFAGGNFAPSDLEETEVPENAWLAPFGRTTAGQTLDLLAERFATPPDTQFTLGGEAIPMTIAGKDAFHGWADGTSFSTRDSEVRALSDDELVFGSSFHLTQEGEEGPEGRWAIWGRASLSKMEDTDDGVSVSGEVTTGVLGADWERGRWLAGLSLTRSKGKGQLSQDGTSYKSRSTMTSVSPYLRLRLSERTFVWGLVGRGRGDMTMEEREDEEAPILYRTDLRMTLTAAGMQSKLLTPEQTGGYGLDLKGDVFWVRTKSGDMVAEDGSIFLAATSADSSRLRLALEGSRPFRLESGATLTPMVEVGVRHDGGDSETGAGLDFGGGIAYSGPGSRLTVELRAQTLLLHADGDRREWGISGSFRLVPGELGRGLSASLTHGRGADVVGSDRLWDVGAAAELAAGGYQSLDRLETEVGYGLSAFGGRFTQTPYLGYGDADGNQSMRVGWRLTTPTGLFETSLEANRRQDAVGGVDDGIDLLATARW